MRGKLTRGMGEPDVLTLGVGWKRDENLADWWNRRAKGIIGPFMNTWGTGQDVFLP